MNRDDERARQEFTSEAEELLDALSRDVAELEAHSADPRPELVNKIFRQVHSLKGLAGMLGYSDISDLSHKFEDMLDRLRMGKIAISRDLIDLLYDGVDTLRRLLVAISDPDGAGAVDLPRLVSRIHLIVSAQPEQKEASLLEELSLGEQTLRSLTEYEEHRLHENVRSGRELLSIEVTFDFSDFDERLRALSAALDDSGEVISTLPAIDASGGTGISFRLVYGTALDVAAVQSLAGTEARVTSLRRPKREASAPPLVEAAEGETSLRSVSKTVRVDIARLDRVMNIIGELIIEKNQLEALLRNATVRQNRVLSQELGKVSRNLDRKLDEMQRSVIEIRMVPVGQIYAKLSRAIRKVSRELNKEVNVDMRGEDTELDKMLVEELTDPLMHIIRNALDHAIESADERIAKGKRPNGTLTLNAYQQGNSVVIDVSDDGRGIDPARIREIAVKRGLIGSGEAVDSQRAYDLIFAPGFSTAAEVSEISGRGVGLDVVKRNIQELKGTIDIISEPNRGTTFRIMLPITLAIIQALIVRAAGEQFAIPLTAVEESIRIRGSDIRTVERKEVFTLRDFTLPLLRLSDAFSLRDEGRSDPEGKWFIVVTRSGERLVGLLVDALVRQQEVVIKSVGDRLKSIPGIAGATEVGDNEIILVIDAGSLIERFGGAARDTRAGAAAVR
jgi:two-component system chemotaxis sensor kinase CheA